MFLTAMQIVTVVYQFYLGHQDIFIEEKNNRYLMDINALVTNIPCQKFI